MIILNLRFRTLEISKFVSLIFPTRTLFVIVLAVALPIRGISKTPADIKSKFRVLKKLLFKSLESSCYQLGLAI